MNHLNILKAQKDRTELVDDAELFLEGIVRQMADGEVTADGSYTYDDNGGSAERYMLCGGGPSAWAVFVQFAVDDVTGYLEYSNSSGTTITHIPEMLAFELRKLLRADTRARNAR